MSVIDVTPFAAWCTIAFINYDVLRSFFIGKTLKIL